ncbi:hypothetical protein LWI29_038314 [Acer saccharum]|uniref:Protein FAR1-RELATED SEQUENCE n=1 Tax=Acer saccharum TaxID=4024 RepID=A0AA39W8G3_ACESA|nr:hypothetical protein LWI29_038314 [Acer saccharum]
MLSIWVFNSNLRSSYDLLDAVGGWIDVQGGVWQRTINVVLGVVERESRRIVLLEWLRDRPDELEWWRERPVVAFCWRNGGKRDHMHLNGGERDLNHRFVRVEYTNRTHNKYTYCGHSYNTDDQEAAVDPSFLTDHTPSTQHLSTLDNTTTPEVKPTLSELDDPAKLTSLQPSDVIGKEFASVQDAEAFYKNYSLFVGFSIRKDEIRRDRHGMITIRRWVCSKQGYREQKYIDKADKKHEPKGQTREGCRAAMKIKIERNSMMWVVREFVVEHTHKLSPHNHIQFLRSHRTVKDSEIAQLQSWRTVGVKTAQVIDHLVDQSGSYSNVGHTKKDLQNQFDSVRRVEIQTSDADSVISYLTAKSVTDPEFFFDYTLDEDDKFSNLFWADSTSRSDYAFFGDVLAFDATYRTNVYWRPLVMLVGVNHHHSTTIFGFGLLGNETVETYTWLLRTFLVSMHSKMPKSVVTDGDKAMHKAIKTVMSESVRRLCCWHLERNCHDPALPIPPPTARHRR